MAVQPRKGEDISPTIFELYHALRVWLTAVTTAVPEFVVSLQG